MEVNNCRYLLQRREQWREASPQILKALSVSGTANRKSNLLCHTETCLTTLNNCTAALERAVFLLSNECLQGTEHGEVCFSIHRCVCPLCVEAVCSIRVSGLLHACDNICAISSCGIKKTWNALLVSDQVSLCCSLFLRAVPLQYIDSSNLHAASRLRPVPGVPWFNNAEAGWRIKAPVPGFRLLRSAESSLRGLQTLKSTASYPYLNSTVLKLSPLCTFTHWFTTGFKYM